MDHNKQLKLTQRKRGMGSAVWCPRENACDRPCMAPCRQAGSGHPTIHSSLATVDLELSFGNKHLPLPRAPLHYYSRKPRPSWATREEGTASSTTAHWVHMAWSKPKRNHSLTHSPTHSCNHSENQRIQMIEFLETACKCYVVSRNCLQLSLSFTFSSTCTVTVWGGSWLRGQHSCKRQ